MVEKESLIHASRKSFNCDQKRRMVLKVKEYHTDYMNEVKAAKAKVNYNDKRRKHTTVLPKEGYIAKAVIKAFKFQRC